MSNKNSAKAILKIKLLYKSKNLDNSKPTYVVLIDMAKAFDKSIIRIYYKNYLIIKSPLVILI